MRALELLDRNSEELKAKLDVSSGVIEKAREIIDRVQRASGVIAKRIEYMPSCFALENMNNFQDVTQKGLYISK